MSKRETKLFAKIFALLCIYHQDPEWDWDVKAEAKDWALRELDKIGIPNELITTTEYGVAKDKFLKWYRAR